MCVVNCCFRRGEGGGWLVSLIFLFPPPSSFSVSIVCSVCVCVCGGSSSSSSSFSNIYACIYEVINMTRRYSFDSQTLGLVIHNLKFNPLICCIPASEWLLDIELALAIKSSLQKPVRPDVIILVD